jgi:hypothetical protein
VFQKLWLFDDGQSKIGPDTLQCGTSSAITQQWGYLGLLKVHEVNNNQVVNCVVLLLIVLFLLLIVLFYALFVRKCVLYYCHRASTQLHLTNISKQQSEHLVYAIRVTVYPWTSQQNSKTPSLESRLQNWTHIFLQNVEDEQSARHRASLFE